MKTSIIPLTIFIISSICGVVTFNTDKQLSMIFLLNGQVNLALFIIDRINETKNDKSN
jgi:hypothetical protein